MTSVDIIDVVASRIKGSDLDVSTTGEVYKGNRPLNSVEEDIVVNALPVTGEQLQRAVVNVNIFVKNVQLMIGGNHDSTQPDFPRLRLLATKAWAVLKDSWALDYNFDVQQEQLIQDPDSGQWYLNFRLDFHNINI